MAEIEGEVEYKFKSSRKNAGELIRKIGEQLLSGEYIEIPLKIAAVEPIKLKPPENLAVKIEIEKGRGFTELKIELKWREEP